MDATWQRLGDAAGTRGVGVNHIRVAPGKLPTPPHSHGASEELYFVLSGSGLAWQDGDVHEVRPLDCVIHRPNETDHTFVAGPDGLDTRQRGVPPGRYVAALPGGVEGLRIAIVKEGFGHPQSEKVVDELVKKGAAKFKELGATVEEVSIPWHLTGMAVWSAIAVEGATWQMMLGNGYGFNWKGLYVTSLVDAHSAWRERADELSDTLKTTFLFGKYALNKYRGHYYAKAQNLRRRVRAGYDAVLASHDLLLLPTVPMKAAPVI